MSNPTPPPSVDPPPRPIDPSPPPPPKEDKPPKRLWFAFIYRWLVFLLFAIIWWPVTFAVTFGLSDRTETGILNLSIIFALVAAMICSLSRFRILSPKEYLIIERLGHYLKTVNGGITFLCPIIDKVSTDGGYGNFLYQKLTFRIGDNKDDMDMPEDGFSVKANAELRWRIIENSSRRPEKEGSYRFRYNGVDTVSQMISVLTLFIRSKILEYKSVNSLIPEVTNIAKAVANDPKLKQDLEYYGIEIKEGSVFIDIEIPEETKKVRQRQAEGEANSQQKSKEMAWFAEVLGTMKKELEKQGFTGFKLEELQDALIRLKLLEVIEKAGPGGLGDLTMIQLLGQVSGSGLIGQPAKRSNRQSRNQEGGK
jgi:hypothetical protein